MKAAERVQRLERMEQTLKEELTHLLKEEVALRQRAVDTEANLHAVEKLLDLARRAA